MAPTMNVEGLVKRYYYGYCNGYYGYCNSNWDTWGRWVALAAILVFAFLVVLFCSCFTARRRRRRGLTPYYGTGWMGGKQGYNTNNQNYYNNGPYNGGAPAPPYEPPVGQQPTGNTFNSADGYYGQQNGVELQPPQHSYQPGRGGEPVYQAPQGPPPGKTGY